MSCEFTFASRRCTLTHTVWGGKRLILKHGNRNATTARFETRPEGVSMFSHVFRFPWFPCSLWFLWFSCSPWFLWFLWFPWFPWFPWLPWFLGFDGFHGFYGLHGFHGFYGFHEFLWFQRFLLFPGFYGFPPPAFLTSSYHSICLGSLWFKTICLLLLTSLCLYLYMFFRRACLSVVQAMFSFLSFPSLSSSKQFSMFLFTSLRFSSLCLMFLSRASIILVASSLLASSSFFEIIASPYLSSIRPIQLPTCTVYKSFSSVDFSLSIPRYVSPFNRDCIIRPSSWFLLTAPNAMGGEVLRPPPQTPPVFLTSYHRIYLGSLWSNYLPAPSIPLFFWWLLFVYPPICFTIQSWMHYSPFLVFADRTKRHGGEVLRPPPKPPPVASGPCRITCARSLYQDPPGPWRQRSCTKKFWYTDLAQVVLQDPDTSGPKGSSYRDPETESCKSFKKWSYRILNRILDPETSIFLDHLYQDPCSSTCAKSLFQDLPVWVWWSCEITFIRIL